MNIQTIEKEDGTIIQSELKGLDEEKLVELQKRHGKNVVGYAPSDNGNIKYIAGEPVGGPANIILVKKKKPIKKLKKNEIVPQTINGVQTDVIEIGEISAKDWGNVGKASAQGATGRFRPVQIGPSAGNITITAGTIGGPAKFSEGVGWCTNSHVGCETINKDLSAQERKDTQSGHYDGGRYPADYIGYTRKAFICSPDSNVMYNDFAFILKDTGIVFEEPLIVGLNLPWLMPESSATVQVGTTYWKPITRTTGMMFNKIMATGATISVSYGSDGTKIHKDCAVLGVTSAGGDSGAWMAILHEGNQDDASVRLDVNRHPSLYLFAGSNTTTIAHDILGAMNAMSIEPYVPGNITPIVPVNEMTVNFSLADKELAGNWVLKGTVRDAPSGAFVNNASISTGAFNATTDVGGEYKITDVPAGSYSVTCTANNYLVQSQGITIAIEKQSYIKNLLWRILKW